MKNTNARHGARLMTTLPRLYDSTEDAAFEDDFDEADADTLPRSSRSGIRSSSEGIGVFFASIVRELEEEGFRRG